MDIAALSTIMSQTQVKHQASLSVMKMTMDTENNQAVDMLRMIEQNTQSAEQAVHSDLGKSIDVKL